MTGALEIAFASALDLAGLYRAKALSPVEVAEALFARLNALQPRLNAFCVIDRDGALAAARDSERRWIAGRPLEQIPLRLRHNLSGAGSWRIPEG
jgi:aspartyl-tRNA(Asn)/glutamyl-tRNA(Gln) amidotransferase subunit A